VLPLARRFLATQLGGAVPELEVALAEALLLHPWTFNVRELQKVVAELAIRGAGAATLELRLVEARLERERAAAGRSDLRSSLPPAPSEAEISDDAPPGEAAIREAYGAHEGNVSGMSRALGRSRRQVRRYLARLGLKEPADP